MPETETSSAASLCFLWRQEKPGGFPFPSGGTDLRYAGIPGLAAFFAEERRRADGKQRRAASGKPRFFLWLEAGREPTEHILNELRESAQVFEAADCALHFLLESPEQEGDPTLQKTLPLLPKARLWQGDFQDTVPPSGTPDVCRPGKAASGDFGRS